VQLPGASRPSTWSLVGEPAALRARPVKSGCHYYCKFNDRRKDLILRTTSIVGYPPKCHDVTMAAVDATAPVRDNAPMQEKQLDRRDARILSLLSDGRSDSTIARESGVSLRTVERRVRSLMDRLGAKTRFQAGVQAARRGWIP
jgi:DNA-binding NarL/FixJ family response regulator